MDEETVIFEGKAAIVTPARDGSGPFRVLRPGVILPDGTLAQVGDSFDPVADKVAPAQLEYWLLEGMVVEKKTTKEFKGPLIEKD